MKTYTLPFLLLCLSSSCQPVNKDDNPNATAANDTVRAYPAGKPDIVQLRRNLFDCLANHSTEDRLDTLEDTYQRYGGPANYPPYLLQSGYLFSNEAMHALIYYNDELGAGLFVYRKQDDKWLQVFSDTTAKVAAGNALPELKDWNGDKTKDLCLYHAPGLSMSVIDHYTLWLMDPNGKHLRYIRGFTEIENPQPDTQSGNITASYYYHGERRSEYRFYKDSVIKIKETWDKQED